MLPGVAENKDKQKTQKSARPQPTTFVSHCQPPLSNQAETYKKSFLFCTVHTLLVIYNIKFRHIYSVTVSDHFKSFLFLFSSLNLLFLFFCHLDSVEKGVKGRVEVPPSLQKHPKHQKESLHELLLREGQFPVNMKVNEKWKRKNL